MSSQSWQVSVLISPYQSMTYRGGIFEVCRKVCREIFRPSSSSRLPRWFHLVSAARTMHSPMLVLHGRFHILVCRILGEEKAHAYEMGVIARCRRTRTY